MCVCVCVCVCDQVAYSFLQQTTLRQEGIVAPCKRPKPRPFPQMGDNLQPTSESGSEGEDAGELDGSSHHPLESHASEDQVCGDDPPGDGGRVTDGAAETGAKLGERILPPSQEQDLSMALPSPLVGAHPGTSVTTRDSSGPQEQGH